MDRRITQIHRVLLGTMLVNVAIIVVYVVK